MIIIKWERDDRRNVFIVLKIMFIIEEREIERVKRIYI